MGLKERKKRKDLSQREGKERDLTWRNIPSNKKEKKKGGGSPPTGAIKK